MYENLALIGAFVFLYSLLSGWLERTPVSGAVVFTAFGLAFGPLGLGILTLTVDAEGLRTLAELTLAMVLFTDASGANLGVLTRNRRIPTRLLLFGLPLTILLGFGAGVLLFRDLTLLEVAILATMLAPTDAALGKAVVKDESVPPEIREGLNVESGLNDGVCVPILFIFLALAASHGAEGLPSRFALTLVAEEVGIGSAVGLGLAAVGAWLIRRSAARSWVTHTWRQLPVVALALLSFSLAQWLGGSGFIACFVGGLLFGSLAKHDKHALLVAAEGTGDTLALVTWVVVGAAVIGQNREFLRWDAALYAVLSLTVVRMGPVFLSLSGMNMRSGEKLFVGWFGPRGLASIVFAVIVLNEHLAGGRTIVLTVIYTIILSIVAHGLSAQPLISWLASARDRSGPRTATES
jgi:NhaP-type Na+/H+ or K+/H+ antiporter